MNHGHHFDIENIVDRQRREQKQKEGEARERLNEAAPALLKACKAVKQRLELIDNGSYTIISGGVFQQLQAAIDLAEKEG